MRSSNAGVPVALAASGVQHLWKLRSGSSKSRSTRLEASQKPPQPLAAAEGNKGKVQEAWPSPPDFRSRFGVAFG